MQLLSFQLNEMNCGHIIHYGTGPIKAHVDADAVHLHWNLKEYKFKT